jgi:hypothetical protein
MALSLNSYQKYIDLKSAEGLNLYKSGLHGFESPLADGQKIDLVNQDFQKLNDQMNHLGSQFGYNYVFKRVPKSHMVIQAIPAVVAIAADPTATPPVLAASAVAAVPEQIIFDCITTCLKLIQRIISTWFCLMPQLLGATIHSQTKCLKLFAK